MHYLHVEVNKQSMSHYYNNEKQASYIISTAKNGVGEKRGSYQTPRGWHIIRAKIGENYPINTVLVFRRPTGEIYNPELGQQFQDRDWILTRILWLSGLEVGKNRFGECDTMRRYIYIHGTPDERILGVPRSKGCIQMYNKDLIALFNTIPVGTKILIE